LTDIQTSRSLIEVLAEMLSALAPNDRMVSFLCCFYSILANIQLLLQLHEIKYTVTGA
jgi:hypothetical protein